MWLRDAQDLCLSRSDDDGRWFLIDQIFLTSQKFRTSAGPVSKSVGGRWYDRAAEDEERGGEDEGESGRR